MYTLKNGDPKYMKQKIDRTECGNEYSIIEPLISLFY